MIRTPLHWRVDHHGQPVEGCPLCKALADFNAAVDAAATRRDTLDDLWLAYDKAVGEGSATWKAEFRRRIEKAYRADLAERWEAAKRTKRSQMTDVGEVEAVVDAILG